MAILLKTSIAGLVRLTCCGLYNKASNYGDLTGDYQLLERDLLRLGRVKNVASMAEILQALHYFEEECPLYFTQRERNRHLFLTTICNETN